ncbi:MAG: insulinase family protein [Acidobacteriia bacterium]|nr:insulinase family protein [Terriglobia bacterium]
MTRRRYAPIILLLPLVLCVWVLPLAAQELSIAKQVIEKDLPNGLKVLIVRRPEIPTVRCTLAFRVGSVNERPGITGISHMHEHMMFKGTQTMGIKPGTLALDNQLNAQIDALEAQIVKEETKVKGCDENKIIALKKQVSDLIAKERAETIVSEEIWGAYQEAGGTGLNASTGNEVTQYYVTLPKNKLELFMALEADRLVNPVFREFYAERDVLVEERRMSENGAGFFFNEQLNATFYAATPYTWEVVGWMSDLAHITKDELKAYRAQYYRPDNAVMVLAGGVDVEPTMALITKYFGSIKNPPGSAPRVRTEEPSPEYYRKVNGPDFKVPYIEKRVIGRAATNPYVTVLFHIPPIWHDDISALYMLGQVISNRSGKMYSEMVMKNEHATSVSASASESEYDGRFTFRATAKEVANNTVIPLDQLEKELWTYIEDAKVTPCDPQVLQRVKNRTESAFLQSLAGTGIAGQLMRMEIAYKWQFIDEQFKQRMAVTPADLMRVAKKYFTRDNSVTGVMEREK